MDDNNKEVPQEELKGKDSSDKQDVVDTLVVTKEVEDPNSKKNRTKTISYIIFLVAMTILVVTLFLSLGEIQQIGDAFTNITKGTNYVWLIVAFIVLIVHFATYPLSLCLIGKRLGTKSKFSDLYLIGASEHFYNGITPFSVGGQPFQVYSIHKNGDTTSKATGIVLGNFIVFLIAVNIFYAVSLIYYPRYVNNIDPSMNWFKYVCFIGYGFNFAFLGFVISLGASKKLANFLVKCMQLLCKIKWINKFLGNKIEDFRDYCDNVQKVIKEMWKHRKTVFFSVVIKFFSYLCSYSLPFFILKSIGIQVGWNDFMLVTLGTVFALSASVWVPTPGGTGGIEYAFKIVLVSLLGGSMFDAAIAGHASAVTLIWRLLNYYIVLIASFICNGIFEGKFQHSLVKQIKQKRLEKNKNKDTENN